MRGAAPRPSCRRSASAGARDELAGSQDDLELHEVAKILYRVQVHAGPPQEIQAPPLHDAGAHAEGKLERRRQPRGIQDRPAPILALPPPRPIGPCVGDELCPARPLLAQLETGARGAAEIGIDLPDLALISGAERLDGGADRSEIIDGNLDLEVAPGRRRAGGGTGVHAAQRSAGRTRARPGVPGQNWPSTVPPVDSSHRTRPPRSGPMPGSFSLNRQISIVPRSPESVPIMWDCASLGVSV
jgi:hypothetical protein